MGILYTNVKRDNSLDFNSEYNSFSKKELLIEFEKFAYSAGAERIEWFDRKESPYKCLLEINEKKYHLYMYLRNISGAGWENKPWIKRVQVPNVRLQHPVFLFVGIIYH